MRRAAFLLCLFSAGLSSGKAAAPSQPREIPFDFVDGFILIHARAGANAAPVTLLLDSGAAVSVFGLAAAKRLHCELGEAEAVRGVDAEGSAYHIAPVEVKAGGMKLTQMPLALDLRNAATVCSRKIDGLIGADFFENRIVQIDYGAHRLRILADAAPENACTVLPIRRMNGVFCVPVGVAGSTPAWTRLDTGCNDALHWVAAADSPRNHKHGLSIGFVSDGEETARLAVRLGDEQLSNVETCLHDRPLFPGEAGLLGSDVLSAYVVTVDAVGGRVLLDKSAE